MDGVDSSRIRNKNFAKGLEARTLKFAVSIIKLSGKLPNTPEGKVVRNQVTKSGTSVGANYREANLSRSRAEFKSRIKICESEASETHYWLEVGTLGTFNFRHLRPALEAKMKKLSFCMVLFLSLILIADAAVAAELFFTPRTSVEQRYSDNIYLDRRDKRSDFITTPTVGFTAQALGGATGLSLSYDAGYSFYARYNENDGWQHNALGSFWHNFTRDTRIDLTNAFLYAKDPLADGDVVDQQGIVVAPGDYSARQGLNTYYRNYSTARLTHQFGPENSTYAQFIYGFVKNSDEQYQDSQEISPSVGMTYWWSSWAGVELDAAYLRGLYDEGEDDDFSQVSGRARLNQRFSSWYGIYEQYQQIYRDVDGTASPGQTTTNSNLNQDYMVYAPSVGAFFEFEQQLRASVGVGYFYQQIENAGDQQGFFPTAEINKLWDYQRWNVRARGTAGIGSQDFAATNQGFERYGQMELLSRYNFTRQFYGDASILYRYSDYIDSEDDQVDHFYRAQIGLGYMVFRWMTVRLSYSFNKLDAINSSDDYQENSIFLSVTLQSDQPYRLLQW